MSLLREIQSSLMQEDKGISPILLKLRFLASRLGSDPLEEWVKHESEGYPIDTEVPDYRKINVSYKASFNSRFASITNTPIPPYLIEKHAGKQWLTNKMRQSISAIDDLLTSGRDGEGGFYVNAADLILLLQGKVYEDLACHGATGTIARASLIELQNAVRVRVLELTIQLEKSIPAAAEITLGPITSPPTFKDVETTNQITQQIVYGNLTTISNTGEGANFFLNIIERDRDSLVKALEDTGITSSDANDLAEIVATEEPESKEEPFGIKAKAWVAKNIVKAADGTWKVGVAIATKVLTEAAMRFYGFK